jgi:type II secretory pathway component PulF
MSNADLADFATEEKASLRPGATGWIVPAFAWAFVLAILAFVVPKFEVVFRDFGVDLPWMMLLIVRASHLWLALLGMVVVLLVVDSIVRDALSSWKDGRGMALGWSALMIGLPLFTIAFMVMALVSLLGGIMWKLSG